MPPEDRLAACLGPVAPFLVLHRQEGALKLEQIQQAIPPGAKASLDIVAIIGWVSALAGMLTPIIGFLAAIASLAWGLIRLYETKTVQRWLKRG